MPAVIDGRVRCRPAGRVTTTVLLLCAGWGAGCAGTRKDEALAILEVMVADDVPPFTSLRFSVPARPEIPAHEIAATGRLRFGYYLPGPDGSALVQAEALAAGCLVGRGTVELDVQLGRVLAARTLTINGVPGEAGCPDLPDGSADTAPEDAPSEDAPSVDAPVSGDGPAPHDAKPPGDGRPPDGPGAEARPPDGPVSPPDAAPPACTAATRPCPGSAPCCAGLSCGMNSLGIVCCGNVGARCARADGKDCCGVFECVGGTCCLPAAVPCQTNGCCAGLVCGMTTLGRVCCGNAGAACTRADGADCCGALECVNGRCTAP
jgi:hypothetical protein